MPQQSSNPDQISDGATKLPELTEQEVSEALLAARKAKEQRLKREAYWARVKAEPEVIVMTPDDLAARAKAKFKLQDGRDFIIDPANSEIFDNLCQYFTGNPGALDIKKGLMLCGNVGVGKTEMMRLFNVNPYAGYGIVSCRHIVDGFIRGSDNDKDDVVLMYSRLRKAAKPNLFNQEWSGQCFDDLGTEQTPAMHYGNSKNVLAEIILNRYDAKLPFQFTHVTTNLPREAPAGEPSLMSTYGTRVLDRMGQMFNIIEFPQLESRR